MGTFIRLIFVIAFVVFSFWIMFIAESDQVNGFMIVAWLASSVLIGGIFQATKEGAN